MSLKRLLSKRDSTISGYLNIEKLKEENLKKRQSKLSTHTWDESNYRNSLSVFQDSVQSIQVDHATHLEECPIIDDVIINPPFMEFKDGSEGVTVKKTLTIRNAGSKAAIVRIKQPNSLAFKIDTILKSGFKLSPGLTLTRTVWYTFKRPSALHAMIPIEINGTLIYYHLFCYLSFYEIKAEPLVLHMGCVNYGSVSDIKKLTITNTGGKSGRFIIDLEKNKLGLNIQPITGIVKPNSKVTVGVQAEGIYQGRYYGQFWIKSNPNIQITIKIDVITPKLEIEHPMAVNEYSLLNFSNTFLQTRKLVKVPLKNYSSEGSSFIIYSEINNKLTNIQDVDPRQNPTYNVFDIYPLEGRLKPFEQIMLSFTFQPLLEDLQLLQNQLENRNIFYFIVKIKICKLPKMEAKAMLKYESVNDPKTGKHFYMEDDADQNEHIKSKEKSSVEDMTMYIHGEVEIPRLCFVPDEFHLGELEINCQIRRVLSIRNPSENLSLSFYFDQRGCVKCEPREAHLKPNQAIEVLIMIKIEFNLETPFKLEFDIYSISQACDEKTKTIRNMKVKVGRNFVWCNYTPILAQKPVHDPAPKKKEMCKPSFDTTGKIVSDSKHSLPKIEDPETNNYNKTLTPSEISNVKVLPAVLDFGEIGQKTVNTRTLTFDNENNFAIHVVLTSKDRQIVEIDDNEAKIKAKSQHDFFIQLRVSKYLGKFNTYLHYKINHAQKYQINMTAKVVRKYLKIDTKHVTFEKDCHPLEGYRVNFKIIEIKNEVNVDTKFKWNLPAGSNFQINPQRGVVPASRKLLMNVEHELNPTWSNRVDAMLHYEGGQRVAVLLEAPLRSPNVTLLNGELDLDEIPLNLPYRACAQLYNAEFFDVFFEIEREALLKGIEVWPTKGIVPQRGITIIMICLKFDVCIEFSTLINIAVHKRLNLQLKILCSVIYPKVKFKPPMIEMKRIGSNSYQVREISAVNMTNRNVTLQFPLQAYPEFRISYSPSKKDDYLNEDDLVTIDPHSCITIFLHFQPYDIASYTFPLPIVINDLLGPLVEEGISTPNEFLRLNEDYYTNFSAISILSVPPKLPSISIHITVCCPKIIINKLLLTFNDDFLKDEITIYNDSKEEIPINLDTECLTEPDCPFRIDWVAGGELKSKSEKIISCLLYPNDEVRLSVEFKPIEKECFKCEVPLNLENLENALPYNRFILEGSYLMHSIDTDVLEIYFVPVPLKETTSENFSLRVCDFRAPSTIETEICEPEKCSGTFISANTLKITFPCGNQIKPHCTHEIPVEIEFKNPRPVSFCTKIIFTNIEKTASCSIMVCASADDSSLTTHIFNKTDTENFIVKKSKKFPSEILLQHDNFPSMQPKPPVVESKTASVSSSVSLVSSLRRDSRFERHYSTDSRKYTNLERHYSTDSRKYASILKKEDASQDSDFDIKTVESSECLKSSGSYYPFLSISNLLNKTKVHLHGTLVAVERWLYSSAMRYQFNPQLIDGITAVASGILDANVESGGKKKDKPLPCTFFDILEYLSESSEVAEINTQLKENNYENEEERICDLLNAYDNILQYLLSQGASIAHISAEFLLNFRDYATYTGTTDCPEFAFNSRSRQSWLDLVLQTYKCIIMKKINFKAVHHHAALISDVELIDSEAHKRYCLDVCDVINRTKCKCAKISCKCTYQSKCKASKNEKILLAWLEYYRNMVFHMNTTVNNFEDFSDGLAFIAVTVCYCPFLVRDFFKDVYKEPVYTEQKMHNIVCLLSAWKKIRIGFIVKPMEIINPNYIQMVMLSAHLFQTLPSYIIKQKLEFNCPLTESLTKTLAIGTSSLHQANYVVQFFGKDTDLFSSKPIVLLPPNARQQIKVTYHARRIRRSHAYLVLCGLAMGPHFAPNQTIVLDGFSDELKIAGEYAVRTKLYHVVDKTISISVPYDFPTEYDIYLSHEKPAHDQLSLIQWTDEERKIRPRRLLINQDKLIVNEDSNQMANLSLTLACYIAESRIYWLIFRSELADFIVQITSNYQSSITEHIAIEMSDDACICAEAPKKIIMDCPQTNKFEILAKNEHLQNCILQMFQKSLKDSERELWSQFLNNDIGFRILKYMIRSGDERIMQQFKHIVSPSVTYKIGTKTPMITLLPPFASVAENQKPTDKIGVTIHVAEKKKEVDESSKDKNINKNNKDKGKKEEPEEDKLRSANITLTSTNAKEIRISKVDFIYNEPPEPAKPPKKVAIPRKVCDCT